MYVWFWCARAGVLALTPPSPPGRQAETEAAEAVFQLRALQERHAQERASLAASVAASLSQPAPYPQVSVSRLLLLAGSPALTKTKPTGGVPVSILSFTLAFPRIVLCIILQN
jgi:hypothetical protein